MPRLGAQTISRCCALTTINATISTVSMGRGCNNATGVRHNQGSKLEEYNENCLQVGHQRAPRVHVAYKRG